MPFPFTRGRVTSRSGWSTWLPSHRHAPWATRRGYSSGTVPASHRLRHLSVGLAATAPVGFSSVDRRIVAEIGHANPPARWCRRVTTARVDLGRYGLLLLGGVGVPVERRLAGRIGQHRIEHLLHRQGVGAATGRLEEVTVTVPCVGVEGDGVGAVVAGEAGAERLELHAVGLVRVAHRLLDLADHARMHVADTSYGAGRPAPYFVAPVGSLPVALASRSFSIASSVTGVGSVW